MFKIKSCFLETKLFWGGKKSKAQLNTANTGRKTEVVFWCSERGTSPLLLKCFMEMASWELFSFILIAVRGCKTREFGARKRPLELEHLHRCPAELLHVGAVLPQHRW